MYTSTYLGIITRLWEPSLRRSPVRLHSVVIPAEVGISFSIRVFTPSGLVPDPFRARPRNEFRGVVSVAVQLG